MATQEQLTGALQVVVNLARCVALKRALIAADPDPALNFWRVLNGNLLDMAVREWCKLFSFITMNWRGKPLLSPHDRQTDRCHHHDEGRPYGKGAIGEEAIQDGDQGLGGGLGDARDSQIRVPWRVELHDRAA